MTGGRRTLGIPTLHSFAVDSFSSAVMELLISTRTIVKIADEQVNPAHPLPRMAPVAQFDGRIICLPPDNSPTKMAEE